MDKNITIVFGQIICPLSFGTNHYIPILGYLGAEALRAKERTTRCCRCVTLEWLVSKTMGYYSFQGVIKEKQPSQKIGDSCP